VHSLQCCDACWQVEIFMHSLHMLHGPSACVHMACCIARATALMRPYGKLSQSDDLAVA